MESYALLIAATLNAGTVLALASLGLLINEKVGIVNLGAEGMMLCAAIAGFATVVHEASRLRLNVQIVSGFLLTGAVD
jgi:simple sugar transport system permease protein